MKFIKKFLSIAVAVLMTAGIVSAAACNPNDGEGSSPPATSYDVTVTYPDGSPVKGSEGQGRGSVSVSLLRDETQIASEALNDLGIARFTVDEGIYDVRLKNLPAGYTYPQTVQTPAKYGKVPIKLTVASFQYVISIVRANGSPAPAGIKVTLTKDDVSLTQTTDSTGKATFSDVEAGEYQISCASLPAGCYAPSATTSLDGQPVEIKLIEPTFIEFDEPMSDDEKSAYSGDYFKEYNVATGKTENKFNSNLNSYLYETEIGAGESKYIGITATISGEYPVFVKSENGLEQSPSGGNVSDTDACNIIMEDMGADFAEAINSFPIGNSARATFGAFGINISNGNNRFLKITNNAKVADNLSIVVQIPKERVSSDIRTSQLDTPISITVGAADEPAILSFVPQTQGVYTLSSQVDDSSVDPMIEYYAYKYATSVDNESRNDDYIGKDFSFSITVRSDEIGNESVGTNDYLFKIMLSNKVDYTPTYPATFNVIIKRTGDAEELDTYENQTVDATSLKEAPQKPNGSTAVGVALDGSQTVYLGSDGAYRVQLGSSRNEANDPLLLAAFACGSRYSDEPFTSLPKPDNENFRSPLVIGDSDTKIQYNYGAFVEAYERVANSEGYVTVTEELATFLKRYEGYHHYYGNIIDSLTLGTEVSEGSEWLIPCYYYAAS